MQGRQEPRVHKAKELLASMKARVKAAKLHVNALAVQQHGGEAELDALLLKARQRCSWLICMSAGLHFRLFVGRALGEGCVGRHRVRLCCSNQPSSGKRGM